MKHEGTELVAQDGGALESKVALSMFGRWQQQRGLEGDAGALLVLKDPLPQDPFEGEGRVDHVQFRTGQSQNRELGDGLPVLEQAVVEDSSRNHEGVLAMFALEREVPELDLYLPWIGDGGVGRDERPVGPGRGRRQQPEEQDESESDAPDGESGDWQSRHWGTCRERPDGAARTIPGNHGNVRALAASAAHRGSDRTRSLMAVSGLPSSRIAHLATNGWRVTVDTKSVNGYSPTRCTG